LAANPSQCQHNVRYNSRLDTPRLMISNMNRKDKQKSLAMRRDLRYLSRKY